MNHWIKAGIQRFQKTDTNDILNVVAEQFQMDAATVVSRKRQRKIVDAKTLYCIICRKVLKMETLKNIGQTVNIDHSNVLHHLKKGQDLLDTDYHFNRRYLNTLEKVRFNPTSNKEYSIDRIGYYYDKPEELERFN